jgi:hypothetical protein
MGAGVGEDLLGGAQVGAGVDAATGAAQELTVGQLGAGPVDPSGGGRVLPQRVGEVAFGLVAVGEQGAAVGGGAHPRIGTARVRRRRRRPPRRPDHRVARLRRFCRRILATWTPRAVSTFKTTIRRFGGGRCAVYSRCV